MPQGDERVREPSNVVASELPTPVEPTSIPSLAVRDDAGMKDPDQDMEDPTANLDTRGRQPGKRKASFSLGRPAPKIPRVVTIGATLLHRSSKSTGADLLDRRSTGSGANLLLGSKRGTTLLHRSFRCTGVDLLDMRSTGSGAAVEELYKYMSRLAATRQHRIPAPLGAPYIIFAPHQTKVVK
ncbi:hypothetical protein LWI29_026506 [Acer saccharum]|uniref:Uncharacterized protein n=1 Tax=Acer saccharum TaxID=4024 RepID=A0AA39S6R9_ACESA|nr:hypothetical protein LWI29_026506 [Acer saccharum]